MLSDTEYALLMKMVIHDLEKPLAVAGQVLNRLLEGKLDLSAEPHVRLIRSSAYAVVRSRRLLADLNEITSTRKIPHRMETFDIGPLVAEITQGFAPIAEPEGVCFEWENGLFGTVRSDPDLICRIMDNFLFNALNHTQRGGGIRLEGDVGDPGRFRLCVSNTGEPIPEAHLEDIFLPGVQLNLRRKRLWRGQGLGLAFCKMAAEAINGSVFARNLPDGDGVTFTLQVGDAGSILSQPNNPSIEGSF